MFLVFNSKQAIGYNIGFSYHLLIQFIYIYNHDLTINYKIKYNMHIIIHISYRCLCMKIGKVYEVKNRFRPYKNQP